MEAASYAQMPSRTPVSYARRRLPHALVQL